MTHTPLKNAVFILVFNPNLGGLFRSLVGGVCVEGGRGRGERGEVGGNPMPKTR